MRQMTRALQQKGVLLKPATRIVDFATANGEIVGLHTAENQLMLVDQVLITAGSWASDLTRKLGSPLLLQAGKGYSISIDTPSPNLRTPTILAEAKVALTPMGQQLRLGGTLELGKPSARINTARVEGILQSVPQYLPDLDISAGSNSKVWQGYRPCTPDGLPYIGQSERWKNLSIATGHGMMGMSLGPATGKLISELLSRRPTTIDVALFDPGRFSAF